MWSNRRRLNFREKTKILKLARLEQKPQPQKRRSMLRLITRSTLALLRVPQPKTFWRNFAKFRNKPNQRSAQNWPSKLKIEKRWIFQKQQKTDAPKTPLHTDKDRKEKIALKKLGQLTTRDAKKKRSPSRYQTLIRNKF